VVSELSGLRYLFFSACCAVQVPSGRLLLRVGFWEFVVLDAGLLILLGVDLVGSCLFVFAAFEYFRLMV
jgi:hypothetical protein